MGIIKTKTRGTLIVISGPCGAGKGTIIDKIRENNKNLWLSISMTSRKPRGNEENGKEYYFVSKEEFEEMIKEGKFLEYAVVHDHQYYGTPKNKIEDKLNAGYDVILELNIEGALNIKTKNKDALFIFIMPPSMKELIKRIIKRDTESKDKILERFKTAYKEINEVTKYN